MTIERAVYLDANVFIYAMETDWTEGDLARRWLSHVDRGALVGVTSELTIAEVLPHPIAAGNNKLIEIYRRLLSAVQTLRVVPVSSEILFRAAELRADLKLATPDAIHVATALMAGCHAVLTNDERLRLPPGLTWCRLADDPSMLR